ncbi:MAG TPA: thioredoxin family protein [Elusimicrobiota bacterium]|nr:thioredoxin family protein [Elusimicrobiota bacterium]
MKKFLKSMFTGLALLGLAAPTHAKEPRIGQKAPNFTLQDVRGQKRSLSDFKGQYVVLEWTNPDCPFVRKHYDSGNMPALQKEMTAKGVVWLAIASSAKGKQGYYEPSAWEKILREKKSAPTALLRDPAGTVGRMYGAKTTPHMFVIDPEGLLLYKGAIDDKPSTDPDDVATAKNYVRAALEEALSGKPVTTSDTSAYGCSVKY